MATNFQFEILTPEKTFYDGTITSLVAPGLEGYFGVLARHAPLIGCSSGGKVKIRDASHLERFFRVGPGVVEVFKNRVIFLTQEASEIEGHTAHRE